MTILVRIENTNSAGDPAYVDVHHRDPKTGAVTPQAIRTYTLDPGKSETVAVYSARVLVVREGLEIPQGEGC